jgi:hypothetical protein
MSFQFQIAGQQVDQGTDSLVAEVALDLPAAFFDSKKPCPPKLFHVMRHGGASDSQVRSNISYAFSYLLIERAGLSGWAKCEQA